MIKFYVLKFNHIGIFIIKDIIFNVNNIDIIYEGC